MKYHVSEEGAFCDDCGVVYLENGSFDAIHVEYGRICTDCYRILEKQYPHLRGVSYH